MKCPLRIIAIPSDEAQGLPVVYDCLKEECAWWLGSQGCCSLVAIANSIENVDSKYLQR